MLNKGIGFRTLFVRKVKLREVGWVGTKPKTGTKVTNSCKYALICHFNHAHCLLCECILTLYSKNIKRDEFSQNISFYRQNLVDFLVLDSKFHPEKPCKCSKSITTCRGCVKNWSIRSLIQKIHTQDYQFRIQKDLKKLFQLTPPSQLTPFYGTTWDYLREKYKK